MTILRAGDREFHNLPAGQVLTVVASAASAGLVRRYPADSGFAAIEVTPVGAGATVNVGPFTGTVRLGVECTTGVVDWAAAPVSPGLAPSVSGDGSVDAASVQAALSSDQPGGRAALGLGSAATQAASAFATAAQGTDAREWVADTVDQAEAEAGIATTRRAWTAERVRQAIAGWATVNRPEVATFAALPAANTVTPGRVYTVLGNITGSAGGAFGTQWASNGTVWRPAGGQVLWHLAAQADGVAGGTTVEQILASPQFPPGVFAGCRAIQLRSRWLTSGTDANARTFRWRVGNTGTADDAAVQTYAAVSASHRTIMFPAHLSPDGSTALLSTWINTVTVPLDGQNTSASVAGAATTVSNMLTNSLYVSASVQQGASPTTQISLLRAWIYVE